ncbi:DUF6252 family protein [Lacinutrix undariae]
MKKIIVLLCMFLTLIGTNCDNNDDNNSGDTLPPETQVGANTVGCLVNGQVFLPKAEGINPAVVVNYEFINGEFFFGLSFADQRGSGVKSVDFGTLRIDLEVGQTYVLDKNDEDNGDFTGGGGSYFLNSSNIFYTNSQNTGQLTITRLDLSNSIISGTFWFDAINTEGEIVEIREGRFDYVY